MNNDYTIESEFIPKTTKRSRLEYYEGIKKGLPITMGYIPVSFTFGLMAVNGGLPAWMAIFISMSNLTSAGQFAGTSLIISNGSLVEIALTTFVINIRYMLMSLSISQKISPDMKRSLRSIIAFCITDETFTIAVMEDKEITFPFMLGLETGPAFGWVFGTALGAISCSFLPEVLQSSMGIALYAMFIALVIPESKKSKAVLKVTLIGVMISCIFTWGPLLNKISGGWRIIIATVIASSVGAIFFPREDD